jgi:hypothetical protein
MRNVPTLRVRYWHENQPQYDELIFFDRLQMRVLWDEITQRTAFLHARAKWKGYRESPCGCKNTKVSSLKVDFIFPHIRGLQEFL